MSSKTEKKIRPQKEKDAEDGQIVLPSPSNIDRTSSNINLDLTTERFKEGTSEK